MSTSSTLHIPFGRPPLNSEREYNPYDSVSRRFQEGVLQVGEGFKAGRSFQIKSQVAFAATLCITSVALFALSQLGVASISLAGVAVMLGVGVVFIPRRSLVVLTQDVNAITEELETKVRDEMTPIIRERIRCIDLLGKLSRVNRSDESDDGEGANVDTKRKNLEELCGSIAELQVNCISYLRSTESRTHIRVLKDSDKIELRRLHFKLLKKIDSELTQTFTSKLNEISESPFKDNIRLAIITGVALLVASIALVIFARLDLILWHPQFAAIVGGTGSATLIWAFLSRKYGKCKATISQFDAVMSQLNQDRDSFIERNKGALKASEAVRGGNRPQVMTGAVQKEFNEQLLRRQRETEASST